MSSAVAKAQGTTFAAQSGNEGRNLLPVSGLRGTIRSPQQLERSRPERANCMAMCIVVTKSGKEKL